jgi:hypothetical protein
MDTKKLNKRTEVAEWYLVNIYPHIKDKESEIELLVTYLSNDAFAVIERMYNEQMSNLEKEGFFNNKANV